MWVVYVWHSVIELGKGACTEDVLGCPLLLLLHVGIEDVLVRAEDGCTGQQAAVQGLKGVILLSIHRQWKGRRQ